jgi:hypothetical protein
MWWNAKLKENQPTPMRIDGRVATLVTDASPQGWGASLQKEDSAQQGLVHCVWSENMKHTSNYHELMTVFLAMKHFLLNGMLSDIRIVHLRTDNTTTTFDINMNRGASTLLHPLTLIMRLVQVHQIHLKASHIPGVENIIADSLSRLERSGDYEIKQEVFNSAVKQLGVKVEIDLFATKENRKVDQYVTVEKDGGANDRDAFSMGWENFFPLIHPPVPLILRSVRKVIQDRVRGVMIVPKWTGQVWNALLNRVTEREIDLGKAEDILQPGRNMIRCGTKLPPGTMTMCLVDGSMKSDGECGIV